MAIHSRYKKSGYSARFLLLTAMALLVLQIGVGDHETIGDRATQIVRPGNLERESRPAVKVSFFSKTTPCESPCWRGLTPGISTEQEGGELAKQFPQYKHIQTTLYGKPVVWDEWYSGIGISDCKLGFDRTSMNSIRYDMGVVQRIDLYHDPNINSSLEDVVRKYGAPEKVMVAFYSVGSGGNLVSFLYASKGLQFDTDFVPDYPAPKRQMQITAVKYFAPSTWQEYRSTFLEGTDSGFGDWTGFTDK